MRSIVLIVVVCILTISNGFSQVRFNTDKFKTGSLASQLKVIEIQYDDVKGSPYADLSFKDGYVFAENVKKIAGLKLRFNIYTDQFEVQAKDSIIYGFTPLNTIHWVGIDSNKYIYHPYITGKKTMSAYFKLAVEGAVSLLVKERRSYHMEEEAKAMIPAKPSRFVKLPNDYFIFVNSEMPIKFKKVSELIELLSNNKSKLTDYVKKEKLKKSKLSNFKQIIEYYNSL